MLCGSFRSLYSQRRISSVLSLLWTQVQNGLKIRIRIRTNEGQNGTKRGGKRSVGFVDVPLGLDEASPLVLKSFKEAHRGINILRGPRSVSFWLPRNLSNHMDRQARTLGTVIVKSREMTGRRQTLPWWLWGEGVKTADNNIHWIHWPVEGCQRRNS